MPLDVFETDWQTQWLVERGVEIISEASRHLSDELKARHPRIPWGKVAGIGNILRHNYENIAGAGHVEARPGGSLPFGDRLSRRAQGSTGAARLGRSPGVTRASVHSSLSQLARINRDNVKSLRLADGQRAQRRDRHVASSRTRDKRVCPPLSA
jgi:hypothetical protein